MDIKDSYLHGTVGVVKSISVSADKLKYTLADIAGTVKEVTLPVATQSANGLLSKEDKTKLDNMVASSIYHTKLTNEDLNTLKAEGKWYYASGGNTTTNIPISNDYGYELYIGRNGGGVRYQQLITSQGQIYFRKHQDSTWTNWVEWKTTDTTYGVVSNSANGLAPKVINTNTDTIGSAYYVLASTNGSATPSWYKLPANAFANDDTKVTQTNTTTNDSYRVLFSGNANDTTETTTARKSGNLLFNPSTGTLTSQTFSGTFITTKSPEITNAWKPQTVMAWFPHINKTSDHYAGDNTGFPVHSNANGILWLGLHNAGSNPSTNLGHGYQLGFSSNGKIYSRYFYTNVPTTANGGSWQEIAYTTSNITGNAATATYAETAGKLKTKVKLWGQDFDGSADVSGDMTGVGNININSNNNVDRFITFDTTETRSWRIGYLGTGIGDSNYLAFQTTKSKNASEGWHSALTLGCETLNATFAGTVIAPTFQGNLDGSYVNKLTGYTKATTATDIAATDTLNTALGKLEYKAGTVYTWYRTITDDDTDDIINKWDEVVDFVNGLDTDLTDEFVTRKTDQTIIGKKIFSHSGYGEQLTIHRAQNNSDSMIKFSNEGDGILGYIGIGGSSSGSYPLNPYWTDGTNVYKFWHTGNLTNLSQLNNDLGFVTGGPYLPLTGGTLKNGSVTNILILDTNSTSEVGIMLRMSNQEKGWIGYHSTYGTYMYNKARQKYLNYKDDGTLQFEGNDVLHGGNYTSYINSTNFPGLAGVRSVTINDKYLKVNTNGTDANLTIPYAVSANKLNEQYVGDLNDAEDYRFFTSGFQATNRPTHHNYATGIALYNSELKYKYQFAIDTYGTAYIRYKNTTDWQSWKQIAFISDIPTVPVVTDYYWANVKIKAIEDKTTIPTFGSVHSTGVITVNLPSSVTNNYNEGIRCNLGGKSSWAGVVIGGDSGSIEGSKEGVYSILVNDKLFRIRQHNTDVINITTSNYVGIGTEAPSYKLHVRNNSTTSYSVACFQNNSNHAGIQIISGSTYNPFVRFSHGSTNAAEIGYDVTNKYFYVGPYNSAIGILHVDIINSRVGINVVKPAYSLDVNGKIALNTDLYLRRNGMCYIHAGINSTDHPNASLGFTVGGKDTDLIALRLNSDGTAQFEKTAKASGFIRNGSGDTYVLLGGGGHKLVSDFATSASLGNYLPLAGGTMTGPITYSSTSGDNKVNNYISTGGGYGTGSGRIGIKLVVIDQTDIQAGLGVNLTGNLYETCLTTGRKNDTTESWLTFATHNAESTDYKQLGYFYASGNANPNITFKVNGTIKANIGHFGYVSPGQFNDGIRLYGKTKADSWSNINFGCDPSAENYTHDDQWMIGRNNVNQFMIGCGGNYANNQIVISKAGAMTTKNSITATKFIKTGSSDDYVLLGAGGQKLVKSFGLVSQNEALDANNIDDGMIGGKLYGATNWPYAYYAFLSVGQTKYKMQFNAWGYNLKFRAGDEDGLDTKSWKTVAFTDSDITGSAAKLSSNTVINNTEYQLYNAEWTDTTYDVSVLATGTYAVQVISGTNLVASGIMSIYNGMSDTTGDEIPLHVYGTAGWRPYLRTYQNKLQISSNDTSSTSRTVTIKIAQIL